MIATTTRSSMSVKARRTAPSYGKPLPSGRLRALQHIASFAGGFLATLWIHARRRHYRRTGEPLTPDERAVLLPYYPAELLDRVRVARPPHIENPFFVRALVPLGLKPPADLRRMMGMAFVDTVALSQGTGRVRSRSVLFHELVHCVQYHVMGTRRFLTAYVRDWLTNGRDYWAIVFEEEAYELTDRYSRGQVFSVEAEVRARIAQAARVVPPPP
jgi:hypothetical protein